MLIRQEISIANPTQALLRPFTRILATALLLMSPIFATADTSPQMAVAQRLQVDALHLLIPGSAGGGWDRTARGIGQALSQSGLVRRIRYQNMSGGGGGKGIAHLIELGSSTMLMVNSTPIVIRSLQGIFPQSFRDLTPIASTIGDYSVIAVRQDSDIHDLQTLLARQRADPRAVAFAGGSVTGGMDHLVAAMVLRGAGGDPRSAKYIPYDTGGKAMAGLLSGETQALASGFSEVIDLVRQNWVRILCIASERRLTLAPATPTCTQAGAQGAVFLNWRGFFAAPNISPARAAAFEGTLAAMYRTPEWAAIRDRNGWVDAFTQGAEFAAMLEAQEATLLALMIELGLR